jgi:hypothetical protein
MCSLGVALSEIPGSYDISKLMHNDVWQKAIKVPFLLIRILDANSDPSQGALTGPRVELWILQTMYIQKTFVALR